MRLNGDSMESPNENRKSLSPFTYLIHSDHEFINTLFMLGIPHKQLHKFELDLNSFKPIIQTVFTFFQFSIVSDVFKYILEWNLQNELVEEISCPILIILWVALIKVPTPNVVWGKTKIFPYL